jgi:mRNA-degrading endonuclease RelE of RelBE toxin-antitoxin system
VFTFIETKLFTRLVQDYLKDEDYQELQATLIDQPELRDVIPGSGGVRNLRWRSAGRGKRSGYRVIYFVTPVRSIIWMLTIYPKNVADHIPASVLNKIRKEVENG